jgi:MFS family permease
MVGLVLGMCNSMIMQTLLSTTLPSISAELGTPSLYSWVYSGYVLASSVTIPLFGSLCDRFGYKINYVLGGTLFLAATAWCALSPSMPSLVAARIAMGIGAGIVVPATYGVIGSLYDRQELRRVFALFAVVQIVSNGAGGILGGFFAALVGWRASIGVLLVPELVGALLIWRLLPASLRGTEQSRIHPLNAAVLTAAILLIMLSINQFGQFGGTGNVEGANAVESASGVEGANAVEGTGNVEGASGMEGAGGVEGADGVASVAHLLSAGSLTASVVWRILLAVGLLVAGLLFLAAFVVRERRERLGLLPSEFKTSPLLRNLSLQVFLLGTLLSVCLVYIPGCLQTDEVLSPGNAGLAVLVYVVSMGLGSIAAGVARTLSLTRLIGLGWTACLAGACVFLVPLPLLARLAPSLVLLGMGCGLLSTALLGHIAAQAERNRAGVNSFGHMIRNIGGSIAVVAFAFTLSTGIVSLYLGLAGLAGFGSLLWQRQVRIGRFGDRA